MSEHVPCGCDHHGDHAGCDANCECGGQQPAPTASPDAPITVAELDRWESEEAVREVYEGVDVDDRIVRLITTLRSERAGRDADARAIVALAGRLVVYHDNEHGPGMYQCVDCCRAISNAKTAFNSHGEELDHSISCENGEVLDDHKGAIDAARDRVKR